MGGLQFYLQARAGQKIHLTSLNLKPLRNASSMEVGYVLDEGYDKVEPIRVSGQEGEQVDLFVSMSSEVTLSLHGTDGQHFLIVFEGE